MAKTAGIKVVEPLTGAVRVTLSLSSDTLLSECQKIDPIYENLLRLAESVRKELTRNNKVIIASAAGIIFLGIIPIIGDGN